MWKTIWYIVDTIKVIELASYIKNKIYPPVSDQEDGIIILHPKEPILISDQLPIQQLGIEK